MSEADEVPVVEQVEWKEPVTSVEWKAPPPGRLRYDWPKITAQLRKKPGEWALIYERDKTSIANALRQGAVDGVTPADGFETMTRNNVRYPVRVCSLFMRYVPSEDRSK